MSAPPSLDKPEGSRRKREKNYVPIDTIAKYYQNIPLIVETMISYDMPTPPHNSSMQPLTFLDGKLAMRDMETKTVSMTLHQGNDESLAARRRVVDGSFLHSYCHYSPPSSVSFEGQLSLNMKIDGNLRYFIHHKGVTFLYSDWLGGQSVSIVLRQAVRSISKLHAQGITHGNISLDSIYFVYEQSRLIIKLDWQLNNDEVVETLEERKRNDWKDLGRAIESMHNMLIGATAYVNESEEFRALETYLMSDGFDLATVQQIIVDHPALWIKRRSLFFFEFVQKMQGRFDDDPLIIAIENEKVAILPQGCGLNWKSALDKDLITIMESERLDYKFREHIREKNINPNNGRAWTEAYHHVVRLKKGEYNGQSAAEYVRFVRNLMSHFEKTNFTSMYEIEVMFRRKQPRTLMTLYDIDMHIA